MERGNRTLGDTLRTMLLRRSQRDWDLLLPQIMRAYRATPHSTTGQTANLLFLGREVRLPDQLYHPTPLPPAQSRASFIRDTEARLQEAHQLLRDQQLTLRSEDSEEPLLFATGDKVWLENKRRRPGVNPKLQSRFIGPYEVRATYPNHTYLLGHGEQQMVVNEQRLKRYQAGQEANQEAPALLESQPTSLRGRPGRPRRRPAPEAPGLGTGLPRCPPPTSINPPSQMTAGPEVRPPVSLEPPTSSCEETVENRPGGRTRTSPKRPNR